MARPAVLVILDGWGARSETMGNAIAAAETPVMDRLSREGVTTEVAASGEAVGLPAGQQGNSEVGHLTIGSGRVIKQPLPRITSAIEDGSFFDNSVLVEAVERARTSGTLHCIGMVSPGGVHSHSRHGIALAELAARHGVERIRFHVITDGRDEPPRSADVFVADFERAIAAHGARIATVGGRYFGMDRDSRWDRVQRAYEVWTGGGPATDLAPADYIREQYTADTGDEFIAPARRAGVDHGAIRDGDTVVVWNFRPDRARQMSHALIDEEFSGFPRQRLRDLALVQMTEYDRSLDAPVAFPREDVPDTLGEVVSAAGLRQFHVAETEKYAHVTYFINGGREQPFEGEERLLVPSATVATYDLQPEMSADAITDAVVDRLEAGSADLIVVNYANADMVGHTGVFDATVAAVGAVDRCLGRIDAALRRASGVMLITADHGNAEQKIDPRDGSPLTAHTTNPVPVVVVGTTGSLRAGGGLADIAPTVLELMDLPRPRAMTGRSLCQTADEVVRAR